MNFQIILRVRKPDRAILNRRLQHHRPAGELAQVRQLFIIQIPDREVFKLSALALVLLPPDFRSALVIRE